MRPLEIGFRLRTLNTFLIVDKICLEMVHSNLLSELVGFLFIPLGSISIHTMFISIVRIIFFSFNFLLIFNDNVLEFYYQRP